MLGKWMHNNRTAAAFILGAIVTCAYLMFVLLDNEEDRERGERDELPTAAEVKHDRRNARNAA